MGDLLEMITTCPSTQLEHVQINVAAHEASGPITQTRLWRSAVKHNQRLAVNELMAKSTGTKAERKKQEFRPYLLDASITPAR